MKITEQPVILNGELYCKNRGYAIYKDSEKEFDVYFGRNKYFIKLDDSVGLLMLGKPKKLGAVTKSYNRIVLSYKAGLSMEPLALVPVSVKTNHYVYKNIEQNSKVSAAGKKKAILQGNYYAILMRTVSYTDSYKTLIKRNGSSKDVDAYFSIVEELRDTYEQHTKEGYNEFVNKVGKFNTAHMPKIKLGKHMRDIIYDKQLQRWIATDLGNI